MNKEEVTALLENILGPIQESLKTISSCLVSKSDLEKEIADLKLSFETKLKERDDTIQSLKDELAAQRREQDPPSIEPVVEDKKQYDLAVFGDSLIRHVDLEKVNPGKENLHCCIPGARCSDIKREMSEFSVSNSAKNIILNVGTNHIPEEGPWTVSHKIKNTLDVAKKLFPEGKLYCNAILPKYGPEFSEGIEFLNRRLHRICKDRGIDFIFNSQFWSEDEVKGPNFRLLAKDKLHLSKVGVA